jgi:hypothetical protein
MDHTVNEYCTEILLVIIFKILSAKTLLSISEL